VSWLLIRTWTIFSGCHGNESGYKKIFMWFLFSSATFSAANCRESRKQLLTALLCLLRECRYTSAMAYIPSKTNRPLFTWETIRELLYGQQLRRLPITVKHSQSNLYFMAKWLRLKINGEIWQVCTPWRATECTVHSTSRYILAVWY
jgi:hypothetical protein